MQGHHTNQFAGATRIGQTPAFGGRPWPVVKSSRAKGPQLCKIGPQ
jgi:hypothetical protein